MANSTALFTIPIPPIPDHPGGTIVCTEPVPAVYLLTFTSPPDNRLTTPFCGALLAALDRLEHSPRFERGVVVTASGIPKFYSNGLDLAHAAAVGPAYWRTALYPLFRRLLTYPAPTVALVGAGHAFAGGLMLAMHHDYRVQSAARGWLCLNELDFGAPLQAPMSSIFREKLPPATYRTLVLEAARLGGPAALAAGVVDVLGGLGEALEMVRARGLVVKGRTGVYGLMKAEMYRESVGILDGHEAEEEKARRAREREDERAEVVRRAVEEAEVRDGTRGKARL